LASAEGDPGFQLLTEEDTVAVLFPSALSTSSNFPLFVF
jgi:hypothetical protein